MDHLGKDAAAALGLSDEDRILYLQTPRWINHAGVQRIQDRLEALMRHPKAHKMRNLLIHGDPSSGKTMVLNEFFDNHPSKFRHSDGITEVPVLLITCPPGTTEAGLYAAILDRLSLPIGSTRDAIALRMRVLHALRQFEVKLLALDEVHHFVNGAVARQRYVMSVLKHLGNEVKIPIVAAGTRDALQVIRSEDQMASRFAEEHLAPWKMTPAYIELLMTFERQIPLRKPSLLHSKELATYILVTSGGHIGEMVNILEAAGEAAIRDGTDQITLEHLKKNPSKSLLGAQVKYRIT